MRKARAPKDLIDYVAELEERIKKLETSPRLSSASIDVGYLALRGGDLIVLNANGEPTMQILHGSLPQIIMHPDYGANAYQASIFSWENPDDNSGVLQLCIEQEQDGSQDGGKLLLMNVATYLSHQPASGNEVYIRLQNEQVRVKGKWEANYNDSMAGLVCGSASVAAGFGSYAYTYPTPIAAGTMVPVVQMVNTAGALAGCLTAMSNTGWTYTWASGTLAKTINYWCFRI